VFITEVLANGNGRQVMRSPLQSELRKRNALSVLITKLQANGNGGHVTRPPPHCGSGTPYVCSGWKRRRMGTAENKVAMVGESAGRLYALAFDVYVSSIPLEY